jgi:HEAT repeat protein
MKLDYEAVKSAGACKEGLKWLRDNPGATVLDIPIAKWRVWVIDEMPEYAAPYLAILSQDEDWYVRAAVAKHPDAGPHLAALAHDEIWYIRADVARRPDAGPYLAALAQDEDWYVRHAVAHHPDAGPFLAALAQDEDKRVSKDAKRRLAQEGTK